MPAIGRCLAFNREHTREVITDERLGALKICATLTSEDTAPTATALPRFTVRVSKAAEVWNTDSVNAALSLTQ